MRVSSGLIIGGACAATTATVLNAYVMNKQVYPTIVYLSKSNASMAVLYFQALVFVYLLFQFIRSIFFGDLRAAESEHLVERAWHAVLETCLAFTVFRDDFSSIFVMQFVILLFVKSFHWLADDRVDMMERSPVITLKFHLRMMSIVAFLGAVDSFLVSHAYFTTMVKGASSQVVFGFEYAILMTMIIHITIKYLLHMHDLRTAQTWDNKAVYLLHAELGINLIRCILYGAFALIMLRVHTFPLFSVRPFYQSLRALHKAFTDVVMSRRAIHAMNNQFPLVSSEELEAMDATCIICREEMTGDSSPKRLPCSHVFHAHCLRSWFQRQQTCPTCRTEILGRNDNNNRQNQQQQQPQNAAGQAAPQPNVFPFIAHQFAAFPINQPQNQAAPQNGGVQGAQGPFPHQIFYAQAPANRPEFMNMPPPPMPPIFGMPPFGGMPNLPPMPPGFVPPPPFQSPNAPDYAGFTDEELSRMEGDRRDAVIARLRALDDVMTLLDAAQIQMMQIATIAPLARTNTPSASASANASATTPAPPTAESPSDGPAAPQQPTTSASSSPSDQPSTSTQAAGPSAQTGPKSIFKDNSMSSIPSSRPSSSGNLNEASSSSQAQSPSSRTPEAEEVRLRRLARFERQQQDGQASPDSSSA